MADIFLSYASGNRRKVSVLTGLLSKLGWSVWWDQELAAGREWSSDIQSELSTARCVVVAWSRASVESEWVIREARAGNERGVLVPVLLEPVDPPEEFAAIQAARLTAWAETTYSAELAKLVSRIAALLDSEPRKLEADPSEPAAEELSRVEVAEAVFAYCACFFAKVQQRADVPLTAAYERLTGALAPISDEDLHELLERYLSEFAR